MVGLSDKAIPAWEGSDSVFSAEKFLLSADGVYLAQLQGIDFNGDSVIHCVSILRDLLPVLVLDGIEPYSMEYPEDVLDCFVGGVEFGFVQEFRVLTKRSENWLRKDKRKQVSKGCKKNKSERFKKLLNKKRSLPRHIVEFNDSE